MQGTKIGYAQTTEEDAVEGDEQLVKITWSMQMHARRYGDTTQLSVRTVSWEHADGRLVRFESETQLGPEPTKLSGHVEGNNLKLETTTGQVRQTSTLAWPAETGGFAALEQSLRRLPLAPGERRSIRSLVPIVNQLGTTDLVARDYETTSLLDGEKRLLRVECSLRLPGAQPLNSVVWTDQAGEILKMLTPGIDQVNYRTTREVALAEASGPALDLGLSTSVRLAAPILRAHETTLVRYRVELADGDPAQVFPQGPSQQVRSLGPHLAEVTVRAIRPSDGRVAGPQPAAANDSPPTEADRQPRPLVQSDDPLIVGLAAEAAGDERDPWRASVRLEQFVKQTIRSKNFSQAFSSAGEVARSREGDCTEHAVLLAAMARARGIPARVAMGLVYSEPPGGEPMLAFHMWTEVNIAGRWIPLDATLGLGGIGAGHLKLAQSSLAGVDALAGFLPIAQVLGRLKVDAVLSAQNDPEFGVPGCGDSGFCRA